MIVGVDEVGRGAWAGPLVVGAVALPDNHGIANLRDSKMLTKKQRSRIAAEIKRIAPAIGVGWVSSAEIDEVGLGAALRLAARRAVAQVEVDFNEIIIDGTIRLIDDPRVVTLKKADQLVGAVSAASIIAKVARDQYMSHCDAVFNGYNFAAHVGYGTAAHRQAIMECGVSSIHRKSFAPIAEILNLSFARTEPAKRGAQSMETVAKIEKTVGRIAETTAAEFLIRRGHKILMQNWRTKFCEIDIVSRCADTIYFTEVKYRRNARYGDGLAAITPKKMRQMRFAAGIWVQEFRPDANLRLSAIAMTGSPPEVAEYVESIDI